MAKAPVGGAALAVRATCLKGYYLDVTTREEINGPLREALSARRPVNRRDRDRSTLGHLMVSVASNPLSCGAPPRRHPRLLPDGTREFFCERLAGRFPWHVGVHVWHRCSLPLSTIPQLSAYSDHAGGHWHAGAVATWKRRDLRAVGVSANRRLCDAQAAAAHPAPDVATFLQVTRPSIDEGHYSPGLRFGEQRVMALLAAMAGFSHLIAGFTKAQLTERVAAILDADYTGRQATYDLRRLRRKGLIARRPHTQRYDLTETGQEVTFLFTKPYGRVLTRGLAAMDLTMPDDIATRSPLAQAWRQLQKELHRHIDAGIAAA